MPRSFKLIETLGEGAFGSVHLAEVHEDEGMVLRLAVKCLHPHVGADAEQSRRLRDEARLLGLLQHEHIVRVHGLTRIDGRLAILMEPVQGADLSKLGATPISPRAVAEVVAAVADALDAAWETVPPGQDEPLRVVHRDIKPSNIMVTARGGVKVLDFGVARATFETRESNTRSQQFGTATYMAPERWLDGTAGAPSDVFSLGITLAELAGGEPIVRPRLARDAFAEDLARAVDRLAPWPPLRELAERMVAYDAVTRPTAREVADACRAMAADLPGADLRAWAAEWVPKHAHVHVPTEPLRVVMEDTSADTLVIDDLGGDNELVPGPGYTESLSPPRETLPGTPRPARLAWGLGGITVVVVGWLLWTVATSNPEEPGAVVPEPAPEPVVVVAPEPVEEPVPVVPASAGPEPVVVPIARPAPRPAPVPVAPVPAPLPDPEDVAWGTVTFILEPADLSARTAYGTVTNRKALALPHGVHQLTAGSGDDTWRCTVLVDGNFPTWRVDGRRKSCVQVH